MGPLWKTTIIVWSEYYAGDVELEDLGRGATSGDAYCSKQSSVRVEDPKTDPDWDGTEFFEVGYPEEEVKLDAAS